MLWSTFRMTVDIVPVLPVEDSSCHLSLFKLYSRNEVELLGLISERDGVTN